MNYTMQKQHFHKAKLLSLFWSNNIKSNRTDLTYGLKWNDYLYSCIQGENKKISKFIEEKRAENFMFSYLIFKETEEILNVKSIENDFENLCIKLIKQENHKTNSILQYHTNYQEFNIIIKYFTLQHIRNPDKYTHYLNLYSAHLLTNKIPHNPYFFDLFDLRNFEKLLIFINN